MGKPNIEKMKAKKDVEGLIKALKDKDDDVRVEAAEALGKIGDTRAVEPLIQALKDKDEAVRWQATSALGKIKDAKVVEPLIQALKDEYVRAEAAKSLGKIGDARAAEPLFQALKDKNGYVRWNAAKALSEIKDARAVEPLTQALTDKDERVRKQALEALGKIKDAKVVEPLIQALEDKDQGVRRDAAETLKKMGGKRANEALAQVAKYPIYEVGISKIQRFSLDPLRSGVVPPLNWPQCCCICLERVGPLDFYEISKKEVFNYVPTPDTYVVREVKLKIPYCKNCRHKVKKLFGGESQGVSIEVTLGGATLKFRSPLYFKMFKEANKEHKRSGRKSHL